MFRALFQNQAIRSLTNVSKGSLITLIVCSWTENEAANFSSPRTDSLISIWYFIRLSHTDRLEWNSRRYEQLDRTKTRWNPCAPIFRIKLRASQTNDHQWRSGWLRLVRTIWASRKVGGSERKAKRLTRFTADLRFDRAIEGKLAADRRRTRPRRRDDRPDASVARCFVVVSRRNRVARTDPLVDDDSFSQLDELRTEVQRRDQELLAMSAKMKTLEEQHQDYQRHITVLKESLCAKEEHYNMLQADVSAHFQRYLLFLTPRTPSFISIGTRAN